MSTITQPTSQLMHSLIRRPTHLGGYISRELVDMSTDILVETWLMCRPIHRSSVGRGVHKIHMIQGRDWLGIKMPLDVTLHDTT